VTPIDVQSTLELRNLPDRLADQLVVMIAKGELKPRQRIFEKEICEIQGVSRIPVREALRLLQAQGVVHTEPNRGTYVTEFTSDEMMEMLELRLAVERIALRRIVERKVPKARIKTVLTESLEAMRRAAMLNDRLSFCQADLSFHNGIVELSASPVLAPSWQMLSRGVLVFLMREQETPPMGFDELIAQHERLLELLQSDSTNALDQLIECHILEVVRRRRREEGAPVWSCPSATVLTDRSDPPAIRSTSANGDASTNLA
jgi:DNA-binding GntR family transcriptional regulator